MADDSNTTNPPGDKPAFTPGPWRIAGTGTIRFGKNEWIASVNWRNRAANARLIAAAPYLYEALENLCEILESEEGGDVAPCIGSDNPNEHAVGLARKALSLARGDSK
jgi:hypothetical protein